jgi:hypothetical protein
MRIREYTPSDLDALRRLHAAQGFGYPFPDLESPLFITKLILEDEEPGDSAEDAENAEDAVHSGVGFSLRALAERRGETNAPSPRGLSVPPADAKPRRIAMAILLRLTAEAYLLHDPAAGSPRQRWQRFLCLHEAARGSAAARGLDDVQAFVPPRVARAFGRRLERLGWSHDPWPCFSSRV